VINNAKFDDVRVREALSMGINREVIGDKVLGTGEIPAYSWVPPGMDNYTATPAEISWKDMPYGEKVVKAKALLDEAGYGADNPLQLQLKYNTSDNHKRVAVAIAAMWKPLGVQVELHNSEVKVHYGELKDGVLDIARAGWLADYNDPENFLGLLRCTAQYNYGRWCSEEFDALMDKAQVTLDLDERANIMNQAERIAMDEFAAMPIYYYLSENVVSPKIGGFEDNAFDIHRTRWLTKAE
jgi:oligopeptide transport system substrate-binding protein